MRARPLIRKAAVALVAVSALALTACGNSGGVGGAPSAPQSSAGGKATLNYWTWFPAEATLKKAIAAYQAANPNVTINLREFQNADYQKQLPLALNGGEKLDMAGVGRCRQSAWTSTRSPTEKWVTSSPVATIRATGSCPGTVGSGPGW